MSSDEIIDFQTFSAIDLRIAEIIEAEPIVDSDKLIKLQVDLGDEHRQIVAGIKSFYEPKDLVGRQIVIVANLAPRMMMGYESRGMLLAATDGSPILLQPSEKVKPGTKIN
jgi:methionine--tRNA ligase beta chain